MRPSYSVRCPHYRGTIFSFHICVFFFCLKKKEETGFFSTSSELPFNIEGSKLKFRYPQAEIFVSPEPRDQVHAYSTYWPPSGELLFLYISNARGLEG